MKNPALISPAERRVLAYLKRVGRREVKAIARSLRVTAMAVRHHLGVLEKAGLVKTTLERRGVGRPHYVYSLSASADAFFPKEYGTLASNLIRVITELDGEAKLARIFEHMKEAAVARYSPRMAGKPLRRRVAEMAKIMTQAGYMAEWEQLDHRTFQITEHNCAIASVAQQCQHACVCELAMFRELLQAAVSRQEHIVAGDPCCRYIVQSQQTRKPVTARRARVE
ncbi:transcriptional regulator [Acidobacteriia bacterium AH_259_A11_L15]|nr:transcriptional regulator [Acidobacteriia bacterium AH_259_A11_L15]